MAKKGKASKKRQRAKKPPTVILIPEGALPENDHEALALNRLLQKTCHDDDSRSGHWIDIPYQEWEYLLGTDYARVIDRLSGRDDGFKPVNRSKVDKPCSTQRKGYVDVNEHYSNGATRRAAKLEGPGFCRSYRLVERFRAPRAQKHELKRRRCKVLTQSTLTDPSDGVLVDQFKRVVITIPDGATSWETLAAEIAMTSRHIYALRNYGDRFYSTFTCLPKAVRQAMMTIDDERLVEIDVSNCQQLITAHLLEQWLACEQSEIGGGREGASCSSLSISPGNSCHLYRSLCEAGELYQFLHEQCDGMKLRDFYVECHRPDAPVRREDIKKAVMVVLFGNRSEMTGCKMWEVWQKHFPEVCEYLLDVKTCRRDGKTIDINRDFAKRLRCLEASAMVDGAAKSLILNHPDITVITVHDSILVPERFVDIAKQEVTSQFQRLFGLTPHLKDSIKRRAAIDPPELPHLP